MVAKPTSDTDFDQADDQVDDQVDADDQFFEDEDEATFVPPVDPKMLVPVKVRVLKKGHGKVHTGVHHPESGRPGRYARGAEFSLPRGNAEELEERGFVEIQEG